MKAKNKKLIIVSLLFLISLIVLLLVLNRKPVNVVTDTTPFLDDSGRLVVTTSLFPVYDFAKVVGGDKVSVSLILPPGSEAHAFKLTDSGRELIKKSAIFFYTSSLMENWAPELSQEVTPKTKIIATAENLNNETLDPHVWLDFSKAQAMVDNIATAYQTIDPQNAAYYQQNASDYKQKLKDLDDKYTEGLKDCQFKEFISSGHFAFGCLASRYGLNYQSAQGFIPDDSLDTDKVVRLSKELKDKKQPYVYYEEMIMPHTGELMRQASGANLMPLNAAHNVGPYDIESGVTFLSLMESDLTILRKGLICR